jgi:predicted nucleic acid-binding protein
MAFVDTNIVLRYLLGDHPALTKKAEQLVTRSAVRELVITDVVVAEIVYVLRSTGRDRSQTVEALELLLRTPSLAYENEELTQEVMSLLGSTRLDFADCYLIARARRAGAGLHTFDTDMQRTYDRLK